jgi:hypothetical protein
LGLVLDADRIRRRETLLDGAKERGDDDDEPRE